MTDTDATSQPGTEPAAQDAPRIPPMAPTAAQTAAQTAGHAQSTAQDYDEMPYQSVAYAASSPDRIAAVAHLFGLAPPDPTTARVLELGCASGGNILPYACRFPGARLLGIDLSEGQVATGQERIAALGLDNIEIRHGDIATVELPEAAFDYVVLHGVWSWVPEAAQEAAFALARRCLVPGGLAYISYNTFPGWNMRKTVRDLTTYHAGSGGTPEFRVARARWLLDKLGAMPERGVYSQMLKQEAELNARQPDSYILGEFLADHNRPVYFHEFAARAQAHGLAFLCEADVSSSLPDMLEPETARLIRDIAAGSGLAAEQYMDFFTGRQFRRSILIKPPEDGPLNRKLALSRLADLHLRSDWRRDPEAIEGVERRWCHGETRRDVGAGEDIVLGLLAQAAPGSLPIADLIREVLQRAGIRTEAELGKLLSTLLRLCFIQGLDLTFRPAKAGRADDARPKVSDLVRLEAASGQAWLSSPRHRPVSIGAGHNALVSLLDGTRTRPELVALLATGIAEGRISQDGAAIGRDLDAGAQAAMAERIVAGVLQRLEAGGVFLPPG